MSTVKLPGTFGALRLIELDCGDDMMLLFAAMQEDPTAKLDGFCHLFGSMLDWWKDGGQLYVASCEETDEMLNGHTDTSMFVRNGFPWILPAFVAGKSAGQPIKLLWVHSKLRRRGIGSAMVKLSPFALPAKSSSSIQPRALAFWKRLGL